MMKTCPTRAPWSDSVPFGCHHGGRGTEPEERRTTVMNANLKRTIGLGTLAAAMMLTVGLGSMGVSARGSSQGVALQGATAATVEIEMGAGRLDLSGAATAANVMDGD